MFENGRSFTLKTTFGILCLICASVIFILSTNSQIFAKETLRTSPDGTQGFQQLDMTATFDVQAELERRLKNASEKKLILVWHRPRWFNTSNKKVNRVTCGNCEFTSDRDKVNDRATGAVVFYYSKVRENNMPDADTRNPDQLHVLWQSEPPTHFLQRPVVLRSTYKFNATSSYRRASDFYDNSNLVSVIRAKARNVPKSVIMKMKDKLALSMISNCESDIGAKSRMKIIRRLQDIGLAIDGYGRCFENITSIKKGVNVVTLMHRYKFYMAFENSYHCRDYITEKAYHHGIEALTVPIVWGATKEDYAAHLPKGSYIFAEDFETLESLVDFLKYLDRNDTAYLGYFDWYQKELPLKIDRGINRHCQLCRALHGINYDDRHRPDYDPVNPRIPTFTDGVAKRSIPSIRAYVAGEENPECIAQSAENWPFYKRWKL